MPDGLSLACNSFLVQQAVDNLVQNALDFSLGGGRVRVAVSEEPKRVTIAVTDEGPGIPEFALGRIFERFYSLQRPGNGRKSSGLGLCFVREAAALHGGGIVLENRADGTGARATLRLPQA